MSTVPMLDATQFRGRYSGKRRLTRRVIAAFPADQFETFRVGDMRPFGVIVRELIAMGGPIIRSLTTDE